MTGTRAHARQKSLPVVQRLGLLLAWAFGAFMARRTQAPARRSRSSVTSGGQKSRIGGPETPIPRLV